MSTHRSIDRVCCVILVLTLLLTAVLVTRVEFYQLHLTVGF